MPSADPHEAVAHAFHAQRMAAGGHMIEQIDSAHLDERSEHADSETLA